MVALLFFVTLAGCESAAQKAMPPAGRYVVTVPHTLFYHLGPAQSMGPDLQLARDYRLTVVKRELGYSRVVLDDGQSGYVPTEDIAPVPPDPPPPPGKSRRSRTEPPPQKFQRDESQSPLPLPDPGAPKFRY
jgi:hypothetical protein